jgi:Rha family phage regulatory protein
MSALAAAQPTLAIINGKATTTSNNISTVFGKRHDDVLKAIRNLVEQLPIEHHRNFAETVSERENPSGGAPIKSPAYTITRDGFTLLAMGFTGKRALAFKLAYIDQFNLMEAELQQAPYSVHPSQTISADEANQIRSLITTHAETLPKEKRAQFVIQAWAKLKSHFGVSYRQIPQSEFTEAISLTGRHIALLSPASMNEAQPTTNTLADLPRQIAVGNGYPLEVLMPIYRAIKARIDENSLSTVDNSTSIYQRRWMGYFDGNGVERVHFIDQAAYVFTAGQFAKSMAQGVFSKTEVEDIVFRGHQFLMGDSQHRLDAAKPKAKSFIEQLKGLHPLELLEIAKDAHMQAFMSTPVPQAIAAA